MRELPDAKSMPARLGWEEREERQRHAKARLRFHVSFLDDCIRGILPNDLVLLGAPSGVGKTDLALHIATSNAREGKRVTYLALEAEPRELERRTKFRIMSELAWAQATDAQRRELSEQDYSTWMFNEHGAYFDSFDQEATSRIDETL